jgi:HD-GYP domain-containing protein (c-di-GMP phosphodiesterase class II)
VADVVESMSSHRPYRPALGVEPAVAEIERGRDTVYDREAADALIRLVRDKGYVFPE